MHIGWPGRVYDARVLSSTGREKMKYFSLSGRVIAGKEVPVLVLGDSAYPLLPWMMKPYIDNSTLSQDQ